MTRYKLLKDIPEVGFAGETVDFDTLNSPNNPEELVQAGFMVLASTEDLNKACDEAIAEKPRPMGFFTLEIKWLPGTTDEEVANCKEWISASTKQLVEAPEDQFPVCIQAFTVKRDPKN